MSVSLWLKPPQMTLPIENHVCDMLSAQENFVCWAVCMWAWTLPYQDSAENQRDSLGEGIPQLAKHEKSRKGRKCLKLKIDSILTLFNTKGKMPSRKLLYIQEDFILATSLMLLIKCQKDRAHPNVFLYWVSTLFAISEQSLNKITTTHGKL